MGYFTPNKKVDAPHPNGSIHQDGVVQYGYDARGRLIQAGTTQGMTSYEVNAQGLRVRKQTPALALDSQYHYDRAGHLIGESDTASMRFTQEYIYLDDQAVGVMQ
jgi:YD repeat-containing protein